MIYKIGLYLICVLILLAAAGYIYFQDRRNKNMVEVETSKTNKDEGVIYVDVSGAVVNPGVYSLASESRVGDLISASGGFSKEASEIWISKSLNLSEKLKDSQKVYVPFSWETELPTGYNLITFARGVSESSSSLNPISGTGSDSNPGSGPSSGSAQTGGKTNVNKVSLLELEDLYGVGPKYAEKIYYNRPYTDLEDFVSRSGLPKSTIDKFKDDISF